MSSIELLTAPLASGLATRCLPAARRHFLLGVLAALASACASSRTSQPVRVPQEASRSFEIEQIERRTGGRLGVFALDTQTGQQIAHRAGERFAMCSTFKWVLAAQVLARVDQRQMSPGERVAYGPSDLLEYAPVTEQHVAEGSMTIEALARAAVVVSDNTAANLLLAKVGGPPGLTEFIRSLGDETTRLDRTEPTLNTNDAGDVRDTTSPRAMVELMNHLLCGEALSPGGREQLLQWMQSSETGLSRIRAGLPPGWVVGDKTGTGNNGACNDVAIAFPPGRAPLLIAVYTSEGNAGRELLEAAHADAARVVARRFSGPERPGVSARAEHR